MQVGLISYFMSRLHCRVAILSEGYFDRCYLGWLMLLNSLEALFLDATWCEAALEVIDLI